MTTPIRFVNNDEVKDIVTFEDICQQLIELHKKKNSDYGNAFSKSMNIFGMTYLLSRLHDKLERLIAIHSNGGKINVSDETIDDTLMDLAVYSIMGIEYRNKDNEYFNKTIC